MGEFVSIFLYCRNWDKHMTEAAATPVARSKPELMKGCTRRLVGVIIRSSQFQSHLLLLTGHGLSFLCETRSPSQCCLSICLAGREPNHLIPHSSSALITIALQHNEKVSIYFVSSPNNNHTVQQLLLISSPSPSSRFIAICLNNHTRNDVGSNSAEE